DFWSMGEDLFHLGADYNMFGSVYNYVLKTYSNGSHVKVSDQLDTWYYGIWGVSAEDIWICGNAGRVRRVISGSADEIMDTGVTQTLRAIWGSSAEDVYAVGDGGVVVHYDGVVWTQMTSGTTSGLLGIWGSEGVVSDAEIPTPVASLKMGRIHPNPFNPVTEIEYSIPARGDVEMKVYDISGRLVAVLVDRVMDAGNYRISWDGRNRKGQTVSSGVYFCRLTACGQDVSGKLVLTR
ncbi:MAG TPA: FlgD immunoglobulin-like domain containing protein, partial [Candidatus Krumholzibacterium sp.]|nr:FlgD immunoglobulin-like domain containing protein [Candidatus Krumholzibacterium sp.]